MLVSYVVFELLRAFIVKLYVGNLNKSIKEEDRTIFSFITVLWVSKLLKYYIILKLYKFFKKIRPMCYFLVILFSFICIFHYPIFPIPFNVNDQNYSC